MKQIEIQIKEILENLKKEHNFRNLRDFGADFSFDSIDFKSDSMCFGADFSSENFCVNSIESAEIDFSNNDYLGLGADLSFRAKFFAQMQNFYLQNSQNTQEAQNLINSVNGATFKNSKNSEDPRLKNFCEVADFSLGSCGSRLLGGERPIFAILERFLERLYNCELNLARDSILSDSINLDLIKSAQPKRALLFNSGYHVNTGLLSALFSLKNVAFLCDHSIHASSIDGLKTPLGRKNGAKVLRFAHNDINSAKKQLERLCAEHSAVFILSEGLFSMEGDFGRVRELCELKEQYENAFLIIDEAHSVGSFGERGLGLCAELGLVCRVDFLVLTFGKAFASSGAAVLCAGLWRDFLVNFARSLIYSTALAPINASFSYFVAANLDKFGARREILKENASYFRSKLAALNAEFSELGFEISGEYNIILLVVFSPKIALAIASLLRGYGIITAPVRPPTLKNAALRFSINATHNKAQLDRSLQALREIFCKL